MLLCKNKKPRIRIRTQDARYHPTLHRLTCSCGGALFLSGNGGYRRKLSPDGVHFPRSRATSAAVCRRLAPSVCSLEAHAAYCSRSKRLNLQSHYNISGMICQGFSATFFGRGGRRASSLPPINKMYRAVGISRSFGVVCYKNDRFAELAVCLFQ